MTPLTVKASDCVPPRPSKQISNPCETDIDESLMNLEKICINDKINTKSSDQIGNPKGFGFNPPSIRPRNLIATITLVSYSKFENEDGDSNPLLN